MYAKLLPPLLFTLYTLGSGIAVAQSTDSTSVTFTASAVVAEGSASNASEGDEGKTRSFTGRVVDPNGRVVPGAVIKVAGTKQMVASNASGEFNLTLPVTGQPLQLVATFAGFVDEAVTIPAAENTATVKFVTPKVIKVARKQQLKRYLKTAKRQSKRSSRPA